MGAPPSLVQSSEKPTSDTTPPLRASSDRKDGEEDADNNQISTPANEQDVESAAAVSTGEDYSIFGTGTKRWIVFMVAVASFFSPCSTTIYFPALPALAKALHVSNEEINLSLTTYMIFQGLAPTIFGDLSDMAGRRPAYIIGFVVYLGANIGLALQTSYPALMVLRCLQSSGSSGTVALGNGVVADVAVSSERGTYLGWVMVGPMIGPAVAPVLGGILVEFLGWRSIFWFLTIVGGAFTVLLLATLPETGRNVVGNGSVPPPRLNMSVLNYLELRKLEKSGLSRTASGDERRAGQAELASKRNLRIPNPLKTLHIIMEKDVAVILLYQSLFYAAFYTVMATVPNLFQEIYHYNDLQIGLCYIPLGIGGILGSVGIGKILDLNYKRVARANNFTVDRRRGDDLRNFPIEHARIQVVWPLLALACPAILCYGWVLSRNANLAAPLILQFILGVTGPGVFSTLSVLLVDLYPQSPATATAANNLCRCLTGAAATAVIGQMIQAMGRGWCYTFVGLVSGAASPILLAVTKWGPKWREERRLRPEKAEKEKDDSNT